MKERMLFMGLAVILAFTGCNESKKAPQAVQTAIEKMYPGISKIDWDSEENGLWEAEFKNSGIETTAVFNADGTYIKTEEEIAYASFPKQAQDYISQNFRQAKVKDISKTTDAQGNVTYEAKVKGNELTFDAQGNFLQKSNEENEDAENGEATEENSKSAVSGKVDIQALPKTVNEFITTNYPGYKAERAEHDPMCNGDDAIDVAISKAASAPFSLIFTPDGKFIQQEEDVDIITAPAKITEVLKTKYADYTAGKQIEKLTLADKSEQYMVDISKAGTSKEVVFDTSGNVVCEH